MADNELKRMNRKQLLELLLLQTKQMNAMKERIEELEAKLRDRELIQSEAGSIAEAALKLNGIFEAAQAAADQYLENIKKMARDGVEQHKAEDKSE